MNRWPSFTLLLVLLITITYGYSNAAEVLRITNGEWAPYQSKNLVHFGLASRIMTEAFKAEGIDVEYGFFPWNRSYWLAERGKWDGSAIWQSTKEREDLFYVSEPVIEGVIVFFHLKGLKFDWKELKNLKDYSIGGSIGYSYGKQFDDLVKQKHLSVEQVKTDEQNFTKLLKGRIQIFPCDREVGYYLLQTKFSKSQVDSITHHPRPVKRTAYRLLLSKKKGKNFYFIHFFNRGLRELHKNGMVDQYIRESNNGDYLRR